MPVPSLLNSINVDFISTGFLLFLSFIFRLAFFFIYYVFFLLLSTVDSTNCYVFPKTVARGWKVILIAMNCSHNNFHSILDLLSHMWCHLGKSVWSQTCDFFIFLFDWSAHLEGYILLKPPPELDQWFQSYSNWRILKTIKKQKKYIPFSDFMSQSMLLTSGWFH